MIVLPFSLLPPLILPSLPFSLPPYHITSDTTEANVSTSRHLQWLLSVISVSKHLPEYLLFM